MLFNYNNIIKKEELENEYFQNSYWNLNEIKFIEYFSNEFYEIKYFYHSNPNLLNYLNYISNDYKKIAIDFEWKPDIKKKTNNKISLIQIGSEKGAVVIKINHEEFISLELLNFLQNKKFIGKGIKNDLIKINLTFGNNFKINIEDITITELRKNNISENFLEMIKYYYKEPLINFKDPKITVSNWENINLTNKQIIYAAFDVISLYLSYKNMLIFEK